MPYPSASLVRLVRFERADVPINEGPGDGRISGTNRVLRDPLASSVLLVVGQCKGQEVDRNR